MVKNLFEKTITYLYTILYSCFILCLTRFFLYSKLIPSYPILDVLILMFAIAPIFIFKSRVAPRIYLYLLISILSFLFLANSTYYEASSTMLHLGMLHYLGEAKGVFDWSYIKWYLVVWFVLLIAIYVIIYEIFHKFVFKASKTNAKYYLFGGVVMLILMLLSFVSTSISYKKIYKDNDTIAKKANIEDGKTIINFYTKYLRLSSFETYGVLTFYKSDIDIVFLNGNSGNEIKDVYETKNEDNEFHGILEGYNVFTIMIETGITEMFTEQYTPNLYYLMSNGLNFTNNYNKDKTSSAEIIGFTGSFPQDGINYNYNYDADNSIYKLKINTPYDVPNILGDEYYKSFFHDGVGYYARNSLLGQFGFDSWRHEFSNVHKNGEPGWDFDGSYELDSDYVDIVIDDMYKKDKPFYTFYTTLSTHGPYEEYQGSTALATRDKEFEEMGYTEKFLKYYDEVYGSKYENIPEKYYNYLKHLTCAFMNLDEAIGKIINRLKEEGLFDKTLFIFYGDHDAYYHQSATNPGLSRILTDSNKVSDVRQYQTALFFYNETLTDKYREVYNLDNTDKCEVTDFTSPYIIVPTLLDLLGYDYDTKYYYSLSYFDFSTKYDGLFYSTELGAFFNDGMYSTAPGSYVYLDNEKYNKEDLETIEQIENVKLLKLKTINDYYSEWFYYEK